MSSELSLITINKQIEWGKQNKKTCKKKKTKPVKPENPEVQKELAEGVDWEAELDFSDDSDFDFRPVEAPEYTLPEFRLPDTRKQKDLKKNLSKTLAFIDMNKTKRLKDTCTIIPIPQTNKRYISICGSQKGVSRLIKFMKDIGLISVENGFYQYGADNPAYNCSKTYYYYYQNEVLIKQYCEENNINKYIFSNVDSNVIRDNTTVVDTFKEDIESFERSEVKFSSHLHLLKPDNYSVEQFQRYLIRCLYENYPQLLKYQVLADQINRQYYSGNVEFAIQFIPTFTWTKGKKAVRKIGIRATNQYVSATKKSKEEVNPEFNGYFKADILDQYGLNLEKDVRSSVPRITASINKGYWIPEEIDLYEEIFKEYSRLNLWTADTSFTTELRDAIKSLHMRGYFDTATLIGVHTRNAMQYFKDNSSEEELSEIDNLMITLKKAIQIAEGGNLYDSEIFLHESCIYLDVLNRLLSEGYLVWECYDAFYAKKDGISQEYYEKHVQELVKECASNYINRYTINRK